MRERTANRKRGGLTYGSQTMDPARGTPLRMWLPMRVLGTTLNCLFGLREVTLRGAGLTDWALLSAFRIFAETRAKTNFHRWWPQLQRIAHSGLSEQLVRACQDGNPEA
jgi:hypothetical protein